MKASAVFNADGSVTLLWGQDVLQFNAVSTLINHCNDKGITIINTYTVE